MNIKKNVVIMSSVLALTGCATGGPYHYTSNPSQSVAMNVIEDLTRGVSTYVEDTPDGKDNFSYRSLGEVFGVGMAIASFKFPAQGVPGGVASFAAIGSGFSPGGPMHRNPIMAAYWDYKPGEDRDAGALKNMQIIEKAIVEVAENYDGEVLRFGVQQNGSMTYGLWSLEADGLGCTSDNLCGVRAMVRASSPGELRIADWAGRNSSNKNEKVWRSISYRDDSYSQLLVIKEGMEDADNIEVVYKEISSALPLSFALYLPPTKDLGIQSDYPYVLIGGKENLFKTP